MIKAAEIAKQYDPSLSKRIIDDKNICLKTTKLPMTCFYNSLADTFYTLYSETEPSKINLDHCITYLLAEGGIREEWERKQYSQMMIRGRRIAAQQLKLVQRRNKQINDFKLSNNPVMMKLAEH
jgi:hypothetical protein